ncbi:amidohydrolase [Arthrobacter sp. MYb227]|uniref:metal-dependent hydrolase family protein n=1 Tax=Arthrobacter sp. MYb227 TaxID=1848601 RepID=UPI000CFCA5DA|nr:amidohydrolase family protein [Arthrobacter sp. MYb227]PQZ87746.1 amidohydrolase [Arthrobacter sp. MYb227]
MSTLTITNALIFDGENPELISGNITFSDGLVSAIGSQEEGELIDASGKVVIPGLIDAHFHAYAISLDGFRIERGPLSYSALAGAKRLGEALGRGFTTVRDVAGGDVGLANAIKEGLLPSPRYFYTGPALSQTGGHGDPREADIDVCFSHGHMCEVLDGPEPLRIAVRERLRTGAHAIKIMTSGGVISLTDPLAIPQYSNEEISVVVAEATRRGSYVAAHAYSPEAIMHSVRNGVRSIEHGNLLDEPTAAFMAENNTFLVPTLAAYAAMDRRGDEVGLAEVSKTKNIEVLNAGREAIKIALKAGIKVGFGSDLMGDLADEQLNGLALQIEASGVFETLRSATSVNAELLQEPTLGRLAPGMVADALILDGNPFEDPSVIFDGSRPRTIIQAGAIVDAGTL